MTGGNSLATYNGTFFPADDVVLVTLNYRSNMFGAPHSPELSGTSANFGILDVFAGIGWVQKNIAGEFRMLARRGWPLHIAPSTFLQRSEEILPRSQFSDSLPGELWLTTTYGRPSLVAVFALPTHLAPKGPTLTRPLRPPLSSLRRYSPVPTMPLVNPLPNFYPQWATC